MSQILQPNRLSQHRILPARLVSWVAATVGVCMLAVAGCGGDSDSNESPNSDVVTPPSPTEKVSTPAETTPTESEPPGGLELPPGEIPDQSPPENSELKEGGLELPKDADVPVESSASTGSSVQYGTWEEIEQQVKTSGQITVVDLWSLACEPCLKEFPGLVRLHKSLGQSVTCVAVDMDYDGRKSRPPEYYADRVTAFLESVGAEFTTYISRTPSDDIYSATNLDSIPAVLIYGKDGQLVKVFSDSGDTVGFTYDKDIIPLVTKLAG